MRARWGSSGRLLRFADRGSAARNASVLFFAAGVMTIVNNHLPGGSYHVTNDVVGLAAIAVSPSGWLLPWERWGPSRSLAYFPLCLALLVLNAYYGSTPPQIYGIWFVVAFVWVGLHHPPRTALSLGVPAAVAYVLPLVLVAHPSGEAVRTVTMVIPAAVLIAELLSATNAALMEARAAQEQATQLLATAAVTDDLTGLGNRRSVNTMLDTLGPGDALLLLDLDHFKDVNDRFGHATGDQLLADAGAFLRTSVRGRDDGVARYGGEEFLIVLRAPGSAIGPTAERLLGTWRSLQPLATFSMGAAIHDGTRSPWDTLALADAALYRAKNAGRDQWQLDPAGSVSA